MRTAIFSTYPPRACGIGTFAFDVRTALLGVPDVEDCSALVVVDDPSSPQRPEILQTISQGARGDYVRAARTLGRLDIDVVLLQHEYGIFGGRDGTYALSFARELAQPLVVTLHTVLSKPTQHQLRSAHCAVSRGRAGDRDDRDRPPDHRRARRVRRREASRHTPRRACRPRSRARGARCRASPSLRRLDPRRLRAHRFALPPLELRTPLAGQGARDDDRRASRDRRPPSRSALSDRRTNPSADCAAARRGVPLHARAADPRPRARRPRPVRRPLSLDRGARGSAGRDGRIRDAVHEQRAELLGRVDVRARRGLCRRLDAVLVRRRHAALRRRRRSSRSAIRPRSPTQSAR